MMKVKFKKTVVDVVVLVEELGERMCVASEFMNGGFIDGIGRLRQLRDCKVVKQSQNPESQQPLQS
jgi:hypothetical protein